MASSTVSWGDDGEYPVKVVNYTTGQQGSKLSWLPYRPANADAHREASSVSTAKFEAPAPPAAKDDPIKDPFGDKSAAGKAISKPAAEVPKALTLPVLPADEATSTPPASPGSATKSLPKRWAEKEGKKSDSPAAAAGNGPQLTPTPDNNMQIPSLDKELATNAPRTEDSCPETAEFKPISEISNQIAAKEGNFPPECPIKSGEFVPRAWSQTNYAWTASGLCHKPLYFEDVQLERYGHSWGPYLQPIISQGHFFLTVPILPYLMGVEPPCECMYTLGYYRPGSCAPYMLDPLPISVRAGLMEAGAWTGAAFLVP